MKISALFPKALKPRSNRWRIFLWAFLATVIFGASGIGVPIEDVLRDARSHTNQHSVSGDVRLIAIDNKSLEELGNFPWPRERYAELAEALDRMGAKRIYMDLLFSGKSTAKSDGAFAKSLQRLGHKVVIPVSISEDALTDERTEIYPPEEFRVASLAHISVTYDDFGMVRHIATTERMKQGNFRSMASVLAEGVEVNGRTPIDFSLTPASVPVISAVDVLKGRVKQSSVSGKDVVIGVTYTPLIDAYVAPVYGRIPGVYFHILGAETLRNGPPKTVPWPLSLGPALLIVAACTYLRRRIISVAALAITAAAYIVTPFLLDRHLVYIDIVPSLFLLGGVAAAFSWTELRQMYRSRGTTNAVSGLPNLVALHQRKLDRSYTIVAARIHNYAAVASTLPEQAEKALVEQIAHRLMVGSVESRLYQGDEGIFAWLAEGSASAEDLGAHLEALHTLFRSPVTVEGKQFDLRITFGFDSDSQRTVANRLASALVAVDEAAEEGRKWKRYDPSKLEDADWKLSLLSQLDAAIDAGDLWVAYQPKLDLKTNRIVGAEALARWSHPQKGPISPIEFIIAAEESDRIEKLTQFVLENAIRAAASINRQGIEFDVSVNLSARLIDDENLVAMVKGMLAKHGLDPCNLTLEVTETATLGSSAKHIATLQALKDLGVSISVDDYGTGMSTLDYLQRIPATEIKIDRSFVVAMRENHGTRVMVNSTIQLAHSLGQLVVAEGVEDQDTLDELRRMDCDLVQGYLVGRPSTFRALSKKILGAQLEEGSAA